MVPLARGGLVPHENGIGRCDLPLGRAMLAARRTRNLRGSFRPRLPWTEKRSGRFRNYRPERSTFQCSRTATTNRSTHIIPHGSGKRRSRGNLRNQEDFAARNEYRLKDLPTLRKTRRDLPEIGRFSSRRECLRSLCWSLSFCASGFPPVCTCQVLARFLRVAGANGRRNMRSPGEMLLGNPAEAWQYCHEIP